MLNHTSEIFVRVPSDVMWTAGVNIVNAKIVNCHEACMHIKNHQGYNRWPQLRNSLFLGAAPPGSLAYFPSNPSIRCREVICLLTTLKIPVEGNKMFPSNK